MTFVVAIAAVTLAGCGQKSEMDKLRESAEKGDAKAQFELGKCYSEGKGINKDAAEAAKWYRKAAEQGYAGAQYIYGRCCLDGTGIAKNSSEGLKWLLKAANQGNVNAVYDAGVCYCDGIGVKRNIDMALKYFVLAEKAGHPKCKNKAYEEKLTAATLEENGLNFKF